MRKLASAVLLICIAAAACGGPADQAPGAGGTTTVKVGIIPTIDVAPLYLAKQKGFFTEHGLELELKEVQTGAAATAAVMSGEYQFGFAAPVPEIQAQAKGLPITVIAGAIAQGDPLSQAIVVRKGSPIKAIGDLAGKTVAVNALQGVNDLVLRAAMEKAGGDPGSLKFLPLPYPDMRAALDGGRVDAAFLIEPFLSGASAAGDEVVLRNPQGDLAGKGTAFSTYFSSRSYVAEHAKTVDDFVAALREANEYAQAHPDEVRKIIPTFTAIKPDVAARMAIADYRTGVDEKTFEVLGGFMKEYGWIKDAPDLKSLIRQAP
ncbi:ABC transporter substrate-binding protein [Sphaerisporangium krabiense]|uniref:NitT/TauT family transport system substrate-binding protein n=1 Tax=Sphaerisporangium krabiense TaxID=763782 RepID=A0A7W8ZCA0_9ACTN|nr:ABC transporter substrate-binding protein [Sphaerisporangium krabiense]MBB5631048.1 NitT/TauT family transport system substrate-binding protein [Sphaerisporangium krabiense]GII65931.1 ABC transporter substrate-binding protein [Sphaerisporangium krabiense]